MGAFRWSMRGVPPVDEDWHATCEAIFQGVEGPEWEAMHYHLQGPAPGCEMQEIWREQKSKSAVGP